MKSKNCFIKSTFNDRRVLGQPFSRSLLLLAGAMAFLTPNGAIAHPGHDHHAPQTGLLHWMLAPTHAVPILIGLGLLVGFAMWKFRVLNRSKTLFDADSIKR